MINKSSKKDILPISFFPRERIDKLIEQGLEKPLLLLQAPAGYGKSQALKNFFALRAEKALWLKLSIYDNTATHFWQSFLQVLSDCLPPLFTLTKNLSFPDSRSQFDVFVSYLAAELYQLEEKLVLIVDNYEYVRNEDIEYFFQLLLQAELENFQLILLHDSARPPKLLERTVLKNKLVYLTAKELTFSKEETTEFLKFNHIKLAKKEIFDLIHSTQGIPLALKTFVQIYQTKSFKLKAVEQNAPEKLFAREYALLSEEEQKFLLKVSFFQACPMKLALLFASDEKKVAILQENQFITYEESSQLFILQEAYKAFLQSKQHMLKEEEITDLHLQAGDYFLQEQMHQQAIKSYFLAKDYDKVVLCVMQIPKIRHGRAYCEYILRYLAKLPANYAQNNYLVDCMRGLLLLNNLQVKEGQKVLEKTKVRLEQSAKTAEEKAILGEIYLALADIAILSAKEDFYEYYKKSALLLPNGSRMRNKKLLFLGNNDAFFLFDSQPGAIDKVQDLLIKTEVHVQKITQGSGFGFELLYALEAAYLVQDFAKAHDYAKKTLHKAFRYEQHDIICNTYLILAKIAICCGEYEEAEKQINKIRLYINTGELAELYELRDCVEGWYASIKGDLYNVPRWLAKEDADFYTLAPIDTGRNVLVQAIYLFSQRNYSRASAFLTKAEALFREKSLWSVRVYFYVMQSISFWKTGARPEALASFAKAYQMCYPCRIVMPFLEFGKLIQPLVEEAGKDSAYDAAWLRLLSERAFLLEKNFMLFIKECYKETRGNVAVECILDWKELQILEQLAKGQTLEEVRQIKEQSLEQFKSQLVGIYRKLHAVNAIDAIRIAKQKKYI